MKFYKLHGAGNDFIFFSGVKNIPKEKIIELCDRNFGIGGDGVITINKSRRQFDFEMKYFNSDGSEADFCANGGRCAVLLSHKLKYFEGNKCRFIAGDGNHTAEILSDGNIRLEMKKPESFASGIKFNGIKKEFYFLNTGVEHTVGYFNDIAAIDIDSIGKAIRYNQMFSNGTNVDLVQKINEHTLKIRTYERGVEGETKACGTGITAAGYLDMLLTQDFNERKIITINGVEMTVSLYKEILFISGPVKFVFEGQII
ncbi:MAG: diaminopimelate epimerase [Candidatus Delongbacteria bacterium]|nr:diaminopimelate epimerase [Candidatus Delongbacteria bacterium]MCG2760217.1 diaminopimelate epimerase [Candidatus Delongbacteria bacterium]